MSNIKLKNDIGSALVQKTNMMIMGEYGLNEIDNEVLLNDAYYGKGGFSDGTYLVPHRRESDSKYQKRREVSYYLNYVAPVINSHVDPVFRKEPIRSYDTGNLLWTKFVEDVDFLGNGLTGFMKSAGLMAKILGMVFICVENVTDIPDRMDKQLAERALPYLYTILPNQIKRYRKDKYGRLTYIEYLVPNGERVSGQETQFNTMIWTLTDWTLLDTEGNKIGGAEHKLGRLPIVPLFSRKMEAGNYKAISEFYSIARANARIFNLCSELDEILRNQAFSILTYPGAKTASSGNLEIGTETILGYSPEASNKPAFIAPPSDPAKLLMEQIDRLIKEIFRMGALSNTSIDPTAQSGVAKQWDFQKTNQLLADFAGNCEHVENQIGKLFEKWTNTTVGLTSTYSNDFGVQDVGTAIEEATLALALAIGDAFDKEVRLKIAEILFSHLPDDRFKKIVASIEALTANEAYTQAQQQAQAKVKTATTTTTAKKVGSTTDTNIADDANF